MQSFDPVESQRHEAQQAASHLSPLDQRHCAKNHGKTGWTVNRQDDERNMSNLKFCETQTLSSFKQETEASMREFNQGGQTLKKT
jgi:hypothetical protein